jgi:ADP-ribose pyrophosphatase YjhB (NUDIX family)
MSPYLRRLRARVGHELLLVPSVAVLPRNGAGDVLLVRQSDTGCWGTIGGSVEPDERPGEAAVREAEEEAGVVVELEALVDVLGGPEFRVRYPNGDETAYVSAVYDARVVAGDPRPDGDETIEVRWFSRDELSAADLTPFAHASLTQLGLLATRDGP